MLTILGLGPGAPGQLTLEALQAMEEADRVYLRTAVHPVIPFLKKKKISFKSFDDIYEREDSFEDVYRKIADRIIGFAQTGDIVYAVPGNPLFGEATVTEIIRRCQDENLEYQIAAGVSFIDTAADMLEIDPVEGLKIIDAYELAHNRPDPVCGNIITQIHSRHVASEVKLKLSDIYPDDFKVVYIINGGVPGEEKKLAMPLYEIDRTDEVNHLASLYVPPMPENRREFAKLVDIMATLRAPGGCPWDRKQTHDTLKRYLLEETYEVLDAIEQKDVDNLVEELGDLMLQIVFHAQLGKEEGLFTIGDVIEGISEKMIRRHPHVFGDVQADTAGEVLSNWEEIKKKEKHTHSITEEMELIPASFTALMQADKVQSKASKVGFDWEDPEPALDKVFEEAGEVREELKKGKSPALEEELGDLLFAAVNVIRLAGYQPELVLKKGNRKFINRFAEMEAEAEADGKKLKNMTLDELEAFWIKAKESEK